MTEAQQEVLNRLEIIGTWFNTETENGIYDFLYVGDQVARQNVSIEQIVLTVDKSGSCVDSRIFSNYLMESNDTFILRGKVSFGKFLMIDKMEIESEKDLCTAISKIVTPK